jgi:hypothetical protein
MNLRAVLTLDGTGFDATLSRARGKVAAFGASMNRTLRSSMAGFFTVGAIGMGIRSLIDYAGKIKDTSTATGIATDRLQQFQWAVEKSGGSLDTIITGLRTMANAVDDALSGNKGAVAAFESLGVTIDDLKTKRMEDIFLQVARGYERGGFETKFAALSDVMGRGAMKIAASFQDGFAAAAESFTPISDNMINQIDDIGDRLQLLGKRMMIGLAPAFVFVVNQLRNIWDMLQITIGGAGRIAGSLSAGASMGEAMDDFGKFARGVIDERIADDASYKNPARRALAPLNRTGLTSATTAAGGKMSVSKLESDQLARISGAVGSTQDRNFSIIKEQLAQLRKIERNTKKPAGQATIEF